MTNLKLTASLVLYKTSNVQFEAAISGFISSAPTGLLYVIDNSPQPLESEWFTHPQVVYIHNEANIGFGAAHNRAIEICCSLSDVHLILNPDIFLNTGTVSYLLSRFDADRHLVAGMPNIVYPNGDLQRLCKLLPTPVNLFVRRFLPIPMLRKYLDSKYELHMLSQEQPSEVPSLSGCFLMARSKSLLEVGGFDERFFMYMEDVDLVRRLGSKGKTMYFPAVSVVHEYGKGSYRNLKLLRYHVQSAVKYFNKWGWVVDKHRSVRNVAMLSSLELAEQPDFAADGTTAS